MAGKGNFLGSPPSLQGGHSNQPCMQILKTSQVFSSSVVMETGCPRAAELLNPGCAGRAGRQGIPLCSFRAE